MKLSTFYKSDKWRGLLAQLKIERLNDKGELICEHCGKPITKAYDCIGHHVIELNEDNVDDVSVSLNPENIKLIHFRCHNEIHERFNGYKGQRVYIVYGPPYSGKRRWVESVANADDLIVDIERLWKAVCDSEDKPRRLQRNVFGLRDCLIEQIMMRTGMWRNAYIIGGYPLRTERDRLSNLLGAELVFIYEDEKTCTDIAGDDKKDFVRDWFGCYVE